MTLFKSYITTTFRNLLRNKAYALINLIGMSIGLTAVVLLTAYVDFETGFNSQHENADRLYRVLRRTTSPDGSTQVSTSVSGAVGSAAVASLPQVETFVRVWSGRGTGRPYVTHGDVTLTGRFWQVESNFLDIFNFPLVRGDKATVFETANSIAITESAAKKWFGDEDPVGKTLSMEHVYFPDAYTVTGILADPPAQSSFQFEILTTSLPSSRRVQNPWAGWSANFAWIPVQTWLLVREGAAIDRLVDGLNGLMRTHLGPEIASTDEYHLQALPRMHLHQGVDFGIRTSRNIERIRLVIGIVVLLLIIACINFTNLSASRALTRAKEVGVRKVTGAQRSHLVIQYATEGVIVGLLALIVSILASYVVFPEFAELMSTRLRWDSDGILRLLPLLLAITVASGALAGLYPALFLAALPPADAVRPGYTPGSGRAYLRKGLVLFQFAASILLLIGTYAISGQLDYLARKDLGFNKDNIVLLPLFGTDRGTVTREEGPHTRRYNQVKDAFLSHPDIVSASASHSTMGWGGLPEILRTDRYPEGMRARFMAVDEDYRRTHEIPLLTGRDLDGTREADKREAFILNETAARLHGWTPESALGQSVEWVDKKRKGTVIGVVADFHNRSLIEPIGPVVMAMWQNKWNVLSLRFSPTDLPALVDDLEALWKQFLPTRPFRYEFLDDSLDDMYRDLMRFQSVARLFSFMAVLVACIGLVGLVSFTIERKTKEIGVRKVLGASDAGLVARLLGSQVRPVLYANLIAWPIAFWMVDTLLANFTYRAPIGLSVYLLGSLLIAAIAILSVFYHVYQATRRDPVEALRYE